MSVLRSVGFARRSVPQPVLGKKAYVTWRQRITSLVLLFVLMLVICLVMVAVIGVLIVATFLFVEVAIA